MRTLLFKTWPSTITTDDGTTVWQGAPITGPAKSKAEVCAEVGEEIGRDPVDVAYVVDKVGNRVIKNAKDGKGSNLGWVGFAISMTGSLDSADADFDPDRNEIVVRAHARPPLSGCLAGMKARNVTTGLKAKIYTVSDASAKEDNVITVTSKVIVVGNNIQINVANPDEGCWLTKRNGDVVATPVILANDGSSLDLAFAELPPDGEYYLVVKARSGASTDFAPATVRRVVTVRSAS